MSWREHKLESGPAVKKLLSCKKPGSVVFDCVGVGIVTPGDVNFVKYAVSKIEGRTGKADNRASNLVGRNLRGAISSHRISIPELGSAKTTDVRPKLSSVLHKYRGCSSRAGGELPGVAVLLLASVPFCPIYAEQPCPFPRSPHLLPRELPALPIPVRSLPLQALGKPP
jgi:hypothetical protein